MTLQLNTRQIAGIGLLLFFATLLGFGIHHLIATGTCSSTGYSSYGPVARCPAGTGWWLAFVFVGITGSLAGAGLAARLSLVFAGVFGAIGFGALTLLLDSHRQTSEKIFAGAFGGSFAVVGVIAATVAIASIFTLSRPRPIVPPAPRPTRATASRAPLASPPDASSASAHADDLAASVFGTGAEEPDEILARYHAAKAKAKDHAKSPLDPDAS
jgi:hypothetical protein